MKTITKKEIASLVRISSDDFGHSFEIDTTSDYDCDFALIAFRESLNNTVFINLNGNKTTAYMNTVSKKEFIDCVFYAVNKLRPEFKNKENNLKIKIMKTLKHVYLSKEEFEKDLDDCLTIINYPSKTRKYYVCEHISPDLLRRKVKIFVNR